MIKLKVTDEMKDVLRDLVEYTDMYSEDWERAAVGVLTIVERDLNQAVYNTHVDGDYWQIELENKASFPELYPGAPGCIEVTA